MYIWGLYTSFGMRITFDMPLQPTVKNGIKRLMTSAGYQLRRTATADGAVVCIMRISLFTGTEDVENHEECSAFILIDRVLGVGEVDRREEFFWDGWGDEGDYKWGSCDEAKQYGYTCEEIIERGYSCAECDCAGEGNEHCNGQTAGEQRWNTIKQTVPTGIDVAVGTNPDDSSQYRVHVVYGQYASIENIMGRRMNMSTTNRIPRRPQAKQVCNIR